MGLRDLKDRQDLMHVRPKPHITDAERETGPYVDLGESREAKIETPEPVRH